MQRTKRWCGHCSQGILNITGSVWFSFTKHQRMQDLIAAIGHIAKQRISLHQQPCSTELIKVLALAHLLYSLHCKRRFQKLIPEVPKKAMLIFSASFQFYRMIPKANPLTVSLMFTFPPWEKQLQIVHHLQSHVHLFHVISKLLMAKALGCLCNRCQTTPFPQTSKVL